MNFKSLKKNLVFQLTSSFIIGIISAGITFEIFEGEYYSIKKSLKKHLDIKLLSTEKNKFEKCLPEILKELPRQSVSIIGHAYGSHKRAGLGNFTNIAPHVENFLNNNKHKISANIFTGDVFYIPTGDGWKKLYDKYEPYFNIFIAPGNHDVGPKMMNPAREVFNQQIGIKQPNFPFLIYKEDFDIIVDDSNNEINFSNKIKSLAKNKKNDNLILLRHHVAIKPLIKYGNSRGENKIFNEKLLENLFSSYKKVTIIYGNGGAYEEKPRIACYQHNKINHIVNGIGDKTDDKILIISNGKIYQYDLNKYFSYI